VLLPFLWEYPVLKVYHFGPSSAAIKGMCVETVTYYMQRQNFRKKSNGQEKNIAEARVISGFCHEVDENCAFLGYYAVSSGNCLPTFWEL